MSQIKEVSVPDLGNIAGASIIEIPIKVGDLVQPEQALITLESDKASMDVPAPFAGKVKEIKVKVGDKVSAGHLIVLLETATETVQEKEATTLSGSADSSADSHEATESKSTNMSKKTEQLFEVKESSTTAPMLNKSSPMEDSNAYSPENSNDIHAGPGVRRLAREFGLDLSQIKGTGQKGRILKEDLQNFVKSHLNQTSQTSFSGLPSSPKIDFSQFGETENLSLSRIKKLSAQYLHRNWLLVPHVTQFNEADITALEAFRKAQTDFAYKQNVKLTPLAFIMKAVVVALKKFPTFNASLSSDGEDLIIKKYFHFGIAVDTPEGLVVPVIRNVDKKSLLELSRELGELSHKARSKQLTSENIQGNSFTISSLGGIGGTAFTPIVNLPDVAILGVSKSQYKPCYQNGDFVPRLMLPLSLSYDHRVIDGAEGARFIVYLAELLTDIRLWLL